MIVIVIATQAEQPIPRFFVARDRAGIVDMNFEAYRPAAKPARGVLGCRQEKRSKAAASVMGGHCDRVKPGDAGARRIKHQDIPGKLAAVLGDDQRGAWRSEEVAQASPRQNIDGEGGVLDGDKRRQIADAAAAKFGGSVRRTG